MNTRIFEPDSQLESRPCPCYNYLNRAGGPVAIHTRGRGASARGRLLWPLLVFGLVGHLAAATTIPFDAAPFGLPLPEGNGVLWEDPREIHRVVAHFKDAAPSLERVKAEHLRLEYWGSWWPERHLPKDREPGGGDIGWMELGNWHKYNWREADATIEASGKTLEFRFRPVSDTEFPKVKDYAAPFRYTLKIRLNSQAPLPAIESFEVFTDSTMEPQTVRLAWAATPVPKLKLEAFNGTVKMLEKVSDNIRLARLLVARNADPNTFDRTLITIRNGEQICTFAVDDLTRGPLYLPKFGLAVLKVTDQRNFAAVAAAQKQAGTKTLYDRVTELPEQTWHEAWAGMPPKKSHIYYPLGLDGGRQRFRLDADGGILFRSNDHYLKNRPGADSPRLALEPANLAMKFGLPAKPAHRTLQEESLPICETTWEQAGLVIKQTALVTALAGEQTGTQAPPGDASAVFMALFEYCNTSQVAQTTTLPLQIKAGAQVKDLRLDQDGLLWNGGVLRGQLTGWSGDRQKALSWSLAPGETKAIVLKVPYVALTNTAERAALKSLDFERERLIVADYWRRRLDQSARLITPEPMLNEFYRSQAMHLLVNCEREPGSDRRFARVGSFGYGAYGNESCMMVLDLERRGYHKEAQDCLEAWLHYQGTVGLPGSFESKAGVLYGAGGYEAGGYNQHHGWILWMLAEHYRYTRNEAWLRASATGMVQGADWIIRETARTQNRHELERGLLPAGSLEDIGDWWTWLSTSCYTWRGLDNAAWALAQIQHPDAPRIRQAATDYHTALLTNFRKASERSPVVRLRDGTAVPKIPSQVHRRGRSFGWICETLEGAIHLLITGAMDARSPEADSILKDYEDNLYLSNQYGYQLDNFDQYWFARGGMSMQACLLLNVEPYLYRDDVKQALRAVFNAQAASYFPDVRMNTEHALPELGDWRGDHFKSSDEANAAGWLRYLFVREEGDTLLLGQAVPREWLKAGQRCGLERTATWFGPASVIYTGGGPKIVAQIEGPRRNPPREIRLRFRDPGQRQIAAATVNGQTWSKLQGDWVILPGDIGTASVTATFK